MNGTTSTTENNAMSSEYGRRLFHLELDRVAKTDPERPFLARPQNPADLSAGFEDISYHRVANAVNRTAHWLEKELGKPIDFNTIAYLAPSDVRNILLSFAVSKVGFRVSSAPSECMVRAVSQSTIAAASFSAQQHIRQRQSFQLDQMRHSPRNRSAGALCTSSAGSTPNKYRSYPITEPATC